MAVTPTGPTEHLYGVLSDFEFKPGEIDKGILSSGIGDVYPTHIKASINFTVLHTHSLGHIAVGTTAGPQSPYFPWGEMSAEDVQLATAAQESTVDKNIAEGLKVFNKTKETLAKAKKSPYIAKMEALKKHHAAGRGTKGRPI